MKFNRALTAEGKFAHIVWGYWIEASKTGCLKNGTEEKPEVGEPLKVELQPKWLEVSQWASDIARGRTSKAMYICIGDGGMKRSQVRLSKATNLGSKIFWKTSLNESESV